MRRIELTQNQYAIIDDCDWVVISGRKWRADKISGIWYAVTSIRDDSQIERILSMHRFILGLGFGDKEIVDHVNRNGLDNRRSNLRLVTRQQNAANCKPTIKTSKYKGVHWRKDRNCWVAKIEVSGTCHHLGHHESEIRAALVYDEAAEKHFGEYALLNFPTELKALCEAVS